MTQDIAEDSRPKDRRMRTMAEMATMCLERGPDGECSEDGNSPPEEHPRWCDGCPAGRAGLQRLYGDLPTVTYQPGYLFRWSTSNGLLFLHCIIGEPNVKHWCSRTGLARGPMDWMWVTELPLDPKFVLRHLAQMERHERFEWFRIDGVAPFYPHCLHAGLIDREIEGRKHCADCDSWFDVDADGNQNSPGAWLTSRPEVIAGPAAPGGARTRRSRQPVIQQPTAEPSERDE